MQRDFLLDIFKDCDFSDMINRDNFGEAILNNLPDNFDYNYFYGVSKLCLIPKGSDYVIKIPFNTEWYDWDREYVYFFNANHDDNRKWDYCMSELLIYNLAKKEKIEKIFCKTRFLGCVNNYPIYIQERANPIYLMDGIRYSDHRTDRISEYCHQRNFQIFHSVWMADALEYYGQKIFNNAMSFIKYNHINDLHNENIGYIGNRPVLIDFSGYLE